MKLISVSAFRTRYFDNGEAPVAPTVRAWIDEGAVPGKKIGSSYYVDVHRWECGGDELVAGVLDASAS